MEILLHLSHSVTPLSIAFQQSKREKTTEKLATLPLCTISKPYNQTKDDKKNSRDDEKNLIFWLHFQEILLHYRRLNIMLTNIFLLWVF